MGWCEKGYACSLSRETRVLPINIVCKHLSKSVDIPVMPFLKGKEAVYTGLVTTTLEDSQNITNLKMTGAGKDVFFVLQEPNYVFD